MEEDNEQISSNIFNMNFLNTSKYSFDDDSDIYLDKNTIQSSNNEPECKPIFHTTTVTNFKAKKKKMTIEEANAIRKLKNREAAKKSRTKRKEEIEKLLIENRKLRKDNLYLKKQINLVLCSKCKEKLKELYVQQPPSPSKSTSQLSQTTTVHSFNPIKKSIALFTTIAILICIFMLQNKKDVTNQFRMLQRKNFELSQNEIRNANYSIAGLFITFGDYYMITHKSLFLDKKKYYFENKGSVRILKESEARNFNNDSCTNCVVELDEEKNVLKDSDPLKFKLILFSKHFWDDSGYYYNVNKTLDNEVFYQIECEAVGFTESRINPYKIQQ